MRYHPDERDKARQVAGNARNFNHPLLMLNTTQGVTDALGVSKDQQQVVVWGRRINAGFAATAVLALGWAAYFLQGRMAMLAVSLLTGLNHDLLIYAHHFKEDVALVMGLSVFAMTLALHSKRASWFSALCLGVGCGLAVSGKYVGLVTVPLALLVLSWECLQATVAPIGASLRPRRRDVGWRLLRLPIFVLALSATLSIIHRRVFHSWDAFVNSFAREFNHGLTEHSGLTSARPNLYWIEALGLHLSPMILGLAGLFVLMLIACRRPPRGSWRMLALSLLMLGVVLMCPIPFHRYLLPVLVLSTFLAGLGWAMAWQWSLDQPHPGIRRPGQIGLVLLSLVLVFMQGRLCLNYLDQILEDSRMRLEAWMMENGPEGSRIVQDFYGGLPVMNNLGGKDPTLPRWEVRLPGVHAASAGSLAQLRRQGYTHVIVCELAYSRYFNPYLRPIPSHQEEVQRHRQFYEDLFREGQLIWQYDPDPPSYSYINPPLRVYRLAR